MKQNPFSTALFSIGGIGLALAVITFFGGVSQQSNGAAEGGVGLFALASMLFPIACAGFIAWLLLEGLSWKQPVPRPTAPSSPQSRLTSNA